MPKTQRSVQEDKKNKTKDKTKDKTKINSKEGVKQGESKQSIHQQRLAEYFSKLSKCNDLESLHYAEEDNQQVVQNLESKITSGSIEVPEQKATVDALLTPTIDPSKITDMEMNLYEREAKRIQHLKLISNLNKQINNKEPEEEIPYVLSKAEHEKKVSLIIEEKRKRDQRQMQLRKMAEEKLQQKQLEDAEKRKAAEDNSREKKRLQIEEKITKQKEEHIHFLSQEFKRRKQLEEIKSSETLFKKMSDKYHSEIEMPELEEKKRSYKNLRQFKDRYSVDSIKSHQQDYLERRKNQLEQSKFSRVSKVGQNYIPPERTEKLQKILAEEILHHKLKYSEQQDYVELKRRREENYIKKLKNEHQPKVDVEKQKQIERRLIKEKEHLSKLHLDRDTKKIGLEYLGEVKRIPKKTSEPNTEYIQSHRSEQLRPIKRSLSQYTVLSANKNNEFLEKARERRLQKLINSQENPDIKAQRLQIEAQKLTEARNNKMDNLRHDFSQQVAKQASNLALNSIKAKLSLISLVKQKEQTA